jgi:hypothetical protein
VRAMRGASARMAVRALRAVSDGYVSPAWGGGELMGDPNFNSAELPTANAVPVGHSPGPWRVADHGSGLGVRDALGRRVASLRYKGSSVSAKVPAGENIGNARLIAAAPDLLRALDNLVGPGSVHEYDCDLAEHDASSGCIYCEGRAAVERAGVGGSSGPATRAVITLDGGLVQDVYLDPPGTALIIDYDVDDSDPADLETIYPGQLGYVHGDGEPWGAMHADVRTFAERTLTSWAAEGGE